MPEIWRKTEPDFSIIVWQSTEPVEELLMKAGLSKEERLQWEGFLSDSRKREWLTVRCALRQLVPSEELLSIIYDSNGKPHLETLSVSISHSQDHVAVMTASAGRIGVDIEIIHPRIEKLAKKFMSDEEKDNFGDKSLENLHLIWGAKEVLYKIHSIGDIIFKEDLLVFPFTKNNSESVSASITKKGFEKNFVVSHKIIGRFMLAWTLDR